MGNIRNLLGAGLLGLLAAKAVHAQTPDTGYADMSHAEVRKALYDKATRVSYETWKPQVVDYDGAVLVLFNSSCNQTEQADLVDRNMEVVYLGLVDKFEDATVKGLPIRFEVYDVCGKSKSEFLGITAPWPRTNMYLDGKLVDSRSGGPPTEDKIPNSEKACIAWIESNLLGKPYVKDGQDLRVVYNGTPGASFQPYKQN